VTARDALITTNISSMDIIRSMFFTHHSHGKHYRGAQILGVGGLDWVRKWLCGRLRRICNGDKVAGSNLAWSGLLSIKVYSAFHPTRIGK